jgi:hypothetical protein
VWGVTIENVVFDFGQGSNGLVMGGTAFFNTLNEVLPKIRTSQLVRMGIDKEVCGHCQATMLPSPFTFLGAIITNPPLAAPSLHTEYIPNHILHFLTESIL